jgi:anti-anti-sigma regulatory factor
MNLTVDRARGSSAPVTILRLQGDLDAATYEQVIDKARELYAAGDRDIILDLRGVPYMGSSGLVALHAVALLFEGEEIPDLESGWEAHHAIGRSIQSGKALKHTRLLSVDDATASVRRVLARTGLDRLIPVATDEASALAGL